MADEMPPEVVGEIRVPEGMATGVYANGINGWFNETDVTLDFSVQLTGEPGENGVWINPNQVVARVHMSPRMLAYVGVQIGNLQAAYEARYGDIPPLQDQPPLIPPFVDEEGGD